MKIRRSMFSCCITWNEIQNYEVGFVFLSELGYPSSHHSLLTFSNMYPHKQEILTYYVTSVCKCRQYQDFKIDVILNGFGLS